jgi:predicted AAA+ superfamily ATPase
MKRTYLAKAAKNILQRHGKEWALKAGNKATSSLSRFARKKGYIDREYSMDELVRELHKMHAEGRFNQEEWKKIKEKIKQSLNKRS